MDILIEGVLSQDKAFFKGIVVLLLKKTTQYWLKIPKRIIAVYFVLVLTRRKSMFEVGLTLSLICQATKPALIWTQSK
jgi:hypothetical protein